MSTALYNRLDKARNLTKEAIDAYGSAMSAYQDARERLKIAEKAAFDALADYTALLDAAIKHGRAEVAMILGTEVKT